MRLVLLFLAVAGVGGWVWLFNELDAAQMLAAREGDSPAYDQANNYLLWMAAVSLVCTILVGVWLGETARNRAWTFFERATLGLYLLGAVGAVAGTAWFGFSPLFVPLTALLGVGAVSPAALAFLLLSLLIEPARFEKRPSRVAYIPPPPREPEPPRLHVEIERRRYTIERPKDRR